MARLRIRWRQYVAFGLGGLALGTTALWSQERTPNAAIRVADPGAFQLVGGKAGEQPPAKTIQPPTSEANQPPASSPQPPSPTSTGDSAFDRLMRGGFAPPSTGGGGTAAAGGGGEVSASQAQQASSNPAANVVSGGEAATRATTDTGDLLGKSLSSVGVIVQRRNPIVSAPIIRGYRFGQLGTYADGAFWTPARADLDTIVSKIDSSDIANIVVIKGPYSVRHGAAFSFIDIETVRSPRFDCFQVHGATSFGFRSNGEALSGRQSVWGGEKDWGFRVNYDVMSGNDYSTGNGSLMPSSYNSQNFSLDFGFDLSPNDRIELRALHLSQRNVEFPGVVTGLNKAVTDGYSLRWTSEENDLADRITFDAWYNDTRFQGDNLRPSYQRQFPQFQDLIPGLGRRVQFQLETEGQTGTWGVREAMTWGRDKEAQVTVGGDFRFITQTINEFDTFLISTVNFPLPRSYSTTPGFFVDGVVPVGEELTVKAGARVDFHQAQLRRPASFPNFGNQEDRLVNHFGTFVGNNFVQNFDVLENQHFDTWAAFTTAEYKLSEQVSAQAGYGFAQRPPTLSELFSVGTFIGLVQPGFSVLDGNPNLEKESMHQVDIGLRGDFENVRGGVTAFYSHVFDFVTYQAFTSNTAGATIRGYRYVNTGQASLVGTEFYTEADLTEWLTPFAVMSYVDGRDISRGEPLPGIPPLDSRVGLRFHEATKAPKWALEFTTRMVAAQNRVAFSLGEPTTGGFNELPTGGFTIFDLRGYWQASEKVLLTAGVENLGDRYYREHLDIRAGLGTFQPGVNAYFGVRVNY